MFRITFDTALNKYYVIQTTTTFILFNFKIIICENDIMIFLWHSYNAYLILNSTSGENLARSFVSLA